MTYDTRGAFTCVLCGDPKIAGRKLCKPCYYKQRRLGTLHNFPFPRPEDVFESRIQKTKSCWLWTGGKNGYGYGIFILPGEQKVRAHRYAYEFFVGPIPDGKIIMHTCDNPPCVNPAHLRVGTKDENNKDAAAKRRHHYGLKHWNGKLSDAAVEDIRLSHATNTELALKHGVSQSHICRIRLGKSRV